MLGAVKSRAVDELNESSIHAPKDPGDAEKTPLRHQDVRRARHQAEAEQNRADTKRHPHRAEAATVGHRREETQKYHHHGDGKVRQGVAAEINTGKCPRYQDRYQQIARLENPPGLGQCWPQQTGKHQRYGVLDD